jgi:fucose 4-O-acetylase-like acetyltransferase
MSRGKMFTYLLPLIIIWLIFTKLNIPYLHETHGKHIVLINVPRLGNFFYFYISAFAGSLGLIVISKIIPTNKLITRMGMNTIILLGINGIIFQYINPHLMLKLSNIYILFISTWLITLISYISCYPLINPLNRILKILTNKPETFTGQEA